MHSVNPDASPEPLAVDDDEGSWPLAVALAVIGPIALVLSVALVVIAVAG